MIVVMMCEPDRSELQMFAFERGANGICFAGIHDRSARAVDH